MSFLSEEVFLWASNMSDWGIEEGIEGLEGFREATNDNIEDILEEDVELVDIRSSKFGFLSKEGETANPGFNKLVPYLSSIHHAGKDK